jgi:hypothetical protein
MVARRLNRAELIKIVGNDERALRAFERLLNQVQANITGPANIILDYNSDGTLADSLPVLVSFVLSTEGGQPFTSGVSWGVTVLSGEFDGTGPTIGGTGTGILQINSGLMTNTALLGITARVDGVGYPPFSVTVSKSIAPPDSGGGGTTSSDSTSTFTPITTGTFAPITRDMPITLPAAITDATLTAPSLSLRLENDAPVGTTTVEMKWQRETAPSVWTDVGAVATSAPDPFVEFFSEPPFSLFFQTAGAITCNRTETGMVAGSAQKFRLVARISAGNIRTVTSIGTAGVAS